MTTLAYVRVSTDRQDLSLEAQSEAVRRAAEYHQLPPPELFVDEDTSGGIPFAERPGGQALWRRVRELPEAVLIVPKVDRMGRDTIDVSQTVRALDAAKVRVLFLDLNVDTRTPQGWAFMQIAAVFAELERARIRERVREAMATKRKAGLRTGTIPFGWDAVATGGRTKSGRPEYRLVPNPEEQQWIEAMAAWRAAGWSLEAIAAELNRLGVPTKRREETLRLRNGKTGRPCGRWQFGQVARILARYERSLQVRQPVCHAG